MVHRRGETDDISCRLSSAKCGGRKDTHAIDSNAGAADARIKIESESTLAQAAGAREPSFVLSRGTGKEEQKKLDKVIIRGKGGEGEGLDLLLLRPYDTRPTNTNHHLGSSSSSKGGRETIDCGAGKLGVALWLGGGPGFCQKHRLEGCNQNEYQGMINNLNEVYIQ